MKKLVSTFLALALVLSLSGTALAADTTVKEVNEDGVLGATTTITGSTELPTIEIIVPDSGTVVLNPYQMSVTIDGSQQTGQILSAKQKIENKSNIDIDVGIVAEAVEGSDSNVSLEEEAWTEESAMTDKGVFMFMEMKAVAADTEAAGDNTYDANADYLLSGGEIEVAKAITLDNMNDTGAKKFGVFQLFGKAATNPEEAWTTADTVDVTIAFTFTPVAGTGGNGAGGGSSTPATSVGITGATLTSSVDSSSANTTYTPTVAASNGKVTITLPAGTTPADGDVITVGVTADTGYTAGATSFTATYVAASTSWTFNPTTITVTKDADSTTETWTPEVVTATT